MRGLVISLVFLLMVGFAFVFGLFNQQAGFTLASFCASPVVFIALGWNLRAALGGKRLSLVEAEVSPVTVTGRSDLQRARAAAQKLRGEEA